MNAIQGLGPQISAAMGLSPLWKYMGLGPLSIYASVAQRRYAIFGLGPLPVYAWPAMHLTAGRVYCRYLAPWSTRHRCGASTLCKDTIKGLVPRQFVGLAPVDSYKCGAGSPKMDLSYCGLGQLWSCATVELGPLWSYATVGQSHGVAMLCRVHLDAGGRLYPLACPAV